MKTTAQKFEAMTPFEQWQWIVKNPNEVEMIILDNDNTTIIFKGDGEVDDRYANFKADIGDRKGVEYILSALGIPNEQC